MCVFVQVRLTGQLVYGLAKFHPIHIFIHSIESSCMIPGWYDNGFVCM